MDMPATSRKRPASSPLNAKACQPTTSIGSISTPHAWPPPPTDNELMLYQKGGGNRERNGHILCVFAGHYGSSKYCGFEAIVYLKCFFVVVSWCILSIVGSSKYVLFLGKKRTYLLLVKVHTWHNLSPSAFFNLSSLFQCLWSTSFFPHSFCSCTDLRALFKLLLLSTINKTCSLKC